MEEKFKKTIRIGITIFIIVLVSIIIGLLILKYDVEGEHNLPFDISKIVVISSAEGIQKKEPTAKWDLQIDQNNDIYIYLEKNNNYKARDAINTITLENFQTTNSSEIGQNKIYRPSNVNNILFKNLEEYEIKDKIEYKGDMEESIENLKIANQGGIVYLRQTLSNIGTYTTNEAEQILQDGTIIKNTSATYEQIQRTVNFDMIINLKTGKSYKATITLKLPVENILETGTSNIEITDLEDVAFKRM